MKPETRARNVNNADFKVGDRVRCVDDTDQLASPADCVKERRTYIVRGFNSHSDLFLEGINPSMDARRFEKVEKVDFRVGDLARCIESGGMTAVLTMGKVYEVKGIDLSPVLREPIIEVEGDQGFYTTPYARRFEKVPRLSTLAKTAEVLAAKVGKSMVAKYEVSVVDKAGCPAPKCKLTSGSCTGQANVPHGGTVCLEPVDCPHKEKSTLAAPSDLDQLKAIFAKAGVNARSWQVTEYTRGEDIVKEPAIVLVHGAEDAGPYTEYLFDLKGNILPKGATSFYDRDGVMEQA